MTSGGSRGRRLGQLPRAPREGGTKEGRAKSKGKFQQVFQTLAEIYLFVLFVEV